MPAVFVALDWLCLLASWARVGKMKRKGRARTGEGGLLDGMDVVKCMTWEVMVT